MGPRGAATTLWGRAGGKEQLLACAQHREGFTATFPSVSAQAWRALPASASSRPAWQGRVLGAAIACGLRQPCTRGASRQTLAVQGWKQRVQGASASRIFLKLGIALSEHYLCFLSTHKATALEIICISLTGVATLP